MEEDLFNGYDAGMMSPGRIAQLAVDGRPSKSPFPTLGELLSKQTDSVLPSTGVSSQVKSSPITVPVPDITVQPKATEVSPTTNTVSTSNNSTVNNSFDYSTQAFPEAAQSMINDILSSLSETYIQEETLNSEFNTMQALYMSPSTTINQISKSVDIPEPAVNTVQNTSTSKIVNSPLNSILNLVNEPLKQEPPAIKITPAAVANASAAPSPKSAKQPDIKTEGASSVTASPVSSMDFLKLVNPSIESNSSTTSSQINNIGPSNTSLAESTKVESTDSASDSTTSNFLSAMENLRSVTNTGPQSSQSISNSESTNNVSVKSTNPIKNKAAVNQILNPPNPVAQGVDNLGKVITNTSNTMTSSITDKLSTLTPVAQADSGPANQIVNNNSSSTVNQASQPEQAGTKTDSPAVEAATSSPGMSEYYLQAIHDALIVQGIKIRNI